ncbi:Retrovirus-related Pol polyprotein from transposon RE1 [Bienertia sinuspersici]
MEETAKLDPSSPFYLGSGDQPGNLISHVILKGDNYLTWSRVITLSLKSRRKFGFVDGTISKPTEKKKMLDWQLCSAITACEQSKSMSVEEYYNTLMGLYDDLNRLKPPRGCECGKCECNLAALFAMDREEERLHQFLIGIDDTKYAQVRTNLLSQQPPVTLDRAYQAFLQEERSRAITAAKPQLHEAHVFALPPDRQPTNRVDKSKLHCTHCKRTGHDNSGCCLLHGYPEWWVEKFGRKRGGGGGQQGSTSSATAAKSSSVASSSARAHAVLPSSVSTTAIDCGNGMSAAAAHTVGSPSMPTNSATVAALSDLQPEHVRILLNLINKQQQDKMIGEPSLLSWILDTGASYHVTGDSSCLVDAHSITPCPVGLPNGSHAMAVTKGRVSLANGLILEDVLFVPNLTCNLISVSKLIDDSHCFVQFTDSLCAIQDRLSGNLIGAGERMDGLYFFRRVPKVCAVTNTDISSFELWHRRMGHPSDKVVKLVPAISGSSDIKTLNKACTLCPQVKQTRDSFPDSDSRASRVFEMIHCDLWGSYKTPSSCGAHYFLTIVDDYSRGVWVYLLHDKTEVYSSFTSFFAMVKCQFDVTVKYVRSDNGMEFKHMIPFFDTHGILFQTSCVGTPQQNGRVERKHQHILNVGRALMFQGNLPVSFWGECVLGAVYIINCTPSFLLDKKTPYEILFNKPPNFDELRIFGCLCFAHNQKSKSDKFAPRSRKGVFVGYPHDKKGWKVYDLETGEIFVSRDVKFHENEFPFMDGVNSANTHEHATELPSNNPVIDDEFLDDLERVLALGETAPTNTPPRRTTASSSPHSAAAPSSLQPEDSGDSSSATVHPADRGSPATDVSSTTGSVVSPASATCRGHRTRHPPSWHKDYAAHSITSPSISSHSLTPSCSSGTPYPLAHFVNCDAFSVRHRVFIAAVDGINEPRNFNEAMGHAGWREAMQQEITALEHNNTWVMSPLPPGKKALGCRWVYKVKLNSDGTLERLKARLVIFGNH